MHIFLKANIINYFYSEHNGRIILGETSHVSLECNDIKDNHDQEMLVVYVNPLGYHRICKPS